MFDLAAVFGLLGLFIPLALMGLTVWFAVWVILTLKRQNASLEEIRSRLR